MAFVNLAGVEQEQANEIIKAELTAAGITVHQGKIWQSKGEVKTDVIGVLDPSWGFKRSWTYWVADGDGLPLEASEALHASHGTEVRVDGHCLCPPPSYKNGFAVDMYHVDSAAGLKALADVIRSVTKLFKWPEKTANVG
jgi:hypothetical protein